MTVPLAPILETQRLILRAPAPEDFDAWADFAADEETMRYLGGVIGSGLVALLADGRIVDDPALVILPVVLLAAAVAALWLPRRAAKAAARH